MTLHEPDGVLHRIRLCTKFSWRYPLFVLSRYPFPAPKPDPNPLTYTRQLREPAERRQAKDAKTDEKEGYDNEDVGRSFWPAQDEQYDRAHEYDGQTCQ